MLRTVLVCSVLVGCATPVARLRDPGTSIGGTCAAPPAGVDFMPLRVGVEYLPPNGDPDLASIATASRGRADHDSVTVRDLRRPAPTVHVAEAPSAERSTWIFDAAAIAAIEDPAERYTIEFVNDTLGEDRLRMQRELRMPVFTNRLRHTPDAAPLTYFERREADDEIRFINDVAPGLFRRPLRNLLKKLAFIDQLELAMADYKADHVPFSDEFRGENPDTTSLGRVSMRVSVDDSDDPAEVTYYNWGWRIGSGLRVGELGYRFEFHRNCEANVLCGYDYESGRTTVRADLRYVFDRRTHLNMLLGDDLSFLAGPTAYSFVDSPIDGSPGLLFYVEHLF